MFYVELGWKRELGNYLFHIERLSAECCKIKTTVLTLANHNRLKQQNESAPSGGRRAKQHNELAPSAGKQASHDCLSLVEKVERVLLTNHRA